MRIPRRLPQYPYGDNEDLYFGSGNDSRIYYDGTDLKIEPDVAGSGNVDIIGDMSFPADNDGIHFGAGDDWELSFDGTYLTFKEGGVQEFVIYTTANKTRLRGGHQAGDDFQFGANTVDALPIVDLNGGAGIDFQATAGANIRFYDGNTPAFNFAYSSNVSTIHGGGTSGDDLELEANDTDTGAAIVLEGNGDIALTPTAGSFLKFGTYVAGIKADSIGYIEIQESDGTARRLMVQEA